MRILSFWSRMRYVNFVLIKSCSLGRRPWWVYDDGSFRVKDSCFGEGLQGLMAVGLGRSISSYPSLKNKKSELESWKSALVILRRFLQVLLEPVSKGKASPCLGKGWKRHQEKPAPRDPRDHSHRKRDQWGLHGPLDYENPMGLTWPWGWEGAAGTINQAESLLFMTHGRRTARLICLQTAESIDWFWLLLLVVDKLAHELHCTCLQSTNSANKRADQCTRSDHRRLRGISWDLSPGLNATELRDAAPSMLVTPLAWLSWPFQGCCTGDRQALSSASLKLGHLPALLDWAIALSCSPGDSLLLDNKALRHYLLPAPVSQKCQGVKRKLYHLFYYHHWNTDGH